MKIFSGWGAPRRGLNVDGKGPWGPAGGDVGNEPPPPPPQSGPWGGPGNEPGPAAAGAGRTSFDDLLRKGRARWSGGPGLPGKPKRSVIVWGIIGVVVAWIVFTSTHTISPGQEGVVTRFGRYVHTLSPGIGMTLPAPIDKVEKLDVQNIRSVDLGSQTSEDLMLTGDQNIIDIAYSVRWNISDPERFLFELANPEETIRQVAESAMRAAMSRVSLDDAIGDRRSDIETEVAQTMQRILNSYKAGVTIQGVAIKEADPPQAVNDAFKDVSAAQQDSERYRNAAMAYAQQLRQKAQGEATAFDRIYEQYRLAPEVTRRRMYYETMEQVLSKVDKTIVEAPGVTPYLPLPEVQRRATPAQPQAQQGGGQ